MLELNLRDSLLDDLFKRLDETLFDYLMGEVSSLNEEGLDDEVAECIHRCNRRLVVELVGYR